MDCWHIGNTTVRNPYRLIDGLREISKSEFVGKMVGKTQETKLARFLNEKGIINISPDKLDTDISDRGRKWRAALHQLGFLTPAFSKGSPNKIIENDGIDEKLLPFTRDVEGLTGRPFEITKNGFNLISSDNLHFQQECFLRSLLAIRFPSIIENRFKCEPFSPLRLVIGVLLKLEELGADPVIKAREMGGIVQVNMSDGNIEEVAQKIIKFRTEIDKVKGKINKNKYFKEYNEKTNGITEQKNINTLRDYSDSNFRYLSATGLFISRGGYSLRIVDQKKKLAQMIFASIQKIDDDKYLANLWNSAALPSDKKENTVELLIEKIQYAKSISAPIPDDIVKHSNKQLAGLEADILSRFHYELDSKIDQTAEIEFAKQQRDEWEDIKNYLEHLSEKKRGLFGSDEGPVFLEWTIWRAFLAINSLVSSPMDCRNFKMDQAFMPVSFAAGGDADLVFEFNDFFLVTEVTLSESSRQEAMEGEPVRRHIAKHIEEKNKPVYGLFIARKVDTNTYETYRHGVWYNKDDKRLDLKILPLTISQFLRLLDSHFSNKKALSPEVFAELAEEIFKDTSMEAPVWRDSIVSQSLEKRIG